MNIQTTPHYSTPKTLAVGLFAGHQRGIRPMPEAGGGTHCKRARLLWEPGEKGVHRASGKGRDSVLSSDALNPMAPCFIQPYCQNFARALVGPVAGRQQGSHRHVPPV